MTAFIVIDVSDCEYEYQRAFACNLFDLPKLVIQDSYFHDSLVGFLKRAGEKDITVEKLIAAAAKGLEEQTYGLRYFPIQDLYKGRFVKMRVTGTQ